MRLRVSMLVSPRTTSTGELPRADFLPREGVAGAVRPDHTVVALPVSDLDAWLKARRRVALVLDDGRGWATGPVLDWRTDSEGRVEVETEASRYRLEVLPG